MRIFAKKYLLALALLVLLAAAVAGAVSVVAMLSRREPEPRPTLAAQVPYDLTYRVDEGSNIQVHVDIDAAACNALSRSPLLLSACSLATYVDPTVIASDAHGDLNTRDTGAFVAIVWRARMDAQPSECDDSGLLDGRLDQCHAAVSQPSYEITDRRITVTIP